MTRSEMANHLLHDWLPAFTHAGLGNQFGWLDHVIHDVLDSGTRFWAVDERLSRTERQWKGVFSWMLAIIGARQVLARDRYRWIAPVSAFIPNAPVVDLVQWPLSYPRTRLSIDRRQGHSVNLLPDYVAIPSSRGNVRRPTQWAFAEAKGTPRDLEPAEFPQCPGKWSAQANNGDVSVGGHPIQISRRMVITTRINPQGTQDSERIMQTRLWNSSKEVPQPGDDAAVEVAAAHLFGLCLKLGLTLNAEALTRAAESRKRGNAANRPPNRGELERNSAANAELKNQGLTGSEALEAPFVRISRPSLVIEISNPIIDLIRELRATSIDQAAEALRTANEELDAIDDAFEAPDDGFSPSVTGVRVRYLDRT